MANFVLVSVSFANYLAYLHAYLAYSASWTGLD
jgi:hypothetical protein